MERCGIYGRLRHTSRRTLTAMNEDSPDTVLDDDALNALLDRPFTELSADELMAMKAAYAARGIRIYNSVPWEVVTSLMAAAAIYAKAFLETLAKHHADALNEPCVPTSARTARPGRCSSARRMAQRRYSSSRARPLMRPGSPCST